MSSLLNGIAMKFEDGILGDDKNIMSTFYDIIISIMMMSNSDASDYNVVFDFEFRL